nr:diguanylate cyclase [Actinomycetota bacterium]
MPALVRSEYAREILDDTFPFGVGITGWAVEHREPVLSNQAHLESRAAFVPGTPVDPEALVVVPLIARGSLKGTLNVYRIGERPPSPSRSSSSRSESVALAMMDIDDFKKVNDVYGHGVGDQVLAGLADQSAGCRAVERRRLP